MTTAVTWAILQHTNKMFYRNLLHGSRFSTLHGQKWFRLWHAERSARTLCSLGLISLFISLQKKCAHSCDCADVWEESAFAHPEHTHYGTSWTYKSIYRKYSQSFSCHFWVICLVIRRTWCRTNTKQSHEDLNYLHRDGNEHSRLLELLWGMRTGALQLPQWVHFPLTQEAMAMAFTHQCIQRCATILGCVERQNQ